MTSAPGEWTAEEIERFWSRRNVEWWVPVVVVAAAVITATLGVLLAQQAWTQAALTGRPSANTEVGATLGAIGGVALLAVVWTWRYHDVSPWARAAVTLVCVHIAIAAGAWLLSHRLRTPGRELPLMTSLPAPAIALVAGIVLFVAAAIHVRRRRLAGAPAWLRGVVVFALSYVFVLGIWLPLVVPEESSDYWTYGVVTDYRLRAALIPPAVIALATALVTVLRPRWWGALWLIATVFAVCFLVGAIARRNESTAAALATYANYIHVLFAAAWFGLCALAALAWTHARVLRANRRDIARPAPWVQRGTVEAVASDQGSIATHVGAWHIDGWLAGVRTSVDGFTLRTAGGDMLRVPPGARLVAPVPAMTTGALQDEQLPVVRAGDEVIVSGFVAAPVDGPYRGGALPIPGSDGLVVTARRRHDDTIGRDVVLLLYRPCILFLIFAALAALPGIAGKERGAEPRAYSSSEVRHSY